MAPQLAMGTFRITQDHNPDAAFALANGNDVEIWALRNDVWQDPSTGHRTSTLVIQWYTLEHPVTCDGMRDYLAGIGESYLDFDIRRHVIDPCVYAQTQQQKKA